ncbi:hypothetical protein AB6T38_12920 [Aliiglaciecola sp. SL4]|uniref:hypothetical protein n=1 Tax=Aliiglaciecola sp. SL4 TaxID=3239806 RepID=UPI00355AD2C9
MGSTLWELKGDFDSSSGRAPIRFLNHLFHGGYGGFFYVGLGGIHPLENTVAFQNFELKPVFPNNTSVNVGLPNGSQHYIPLANIHSGFCIDIQW